MPPNLTSQPSLLSPLFCPINVTVAGDMDFVVYIGRCVSSLPCEQEISRLLNGRHAPGNNWHPLVRRFKSAHRSRAVGSSEFIIAGRHSYWLCNLLDQLSTNDSVNLWQLVKCMQETHKRNGMDTFLKPLDKDFRQRERRRGWA